jgi:hypothetical protein
MTARNWNRVLPLRLPMTDPKTGMVTREWVQFLLSDGHKIGRDFDAADMTIGELSAVVDAQALRIAAMETRSFSQSARICWRRLTCCAPTWRRSSALQSPT